MASSKRRSSCSTDNILPADNEAWRDRRQETDALWSRLDDLVTDAKPGQRRGLVPGQSRRPALLQAAIRRTLSLMTPGPLEEAWQAGAGLLAVELKSGKIAHQSLSFQDLTSWIPVEARGNIRMSMDSRDGDDFQSFCQSVVRDVGEPYRDTFWELDKVVGRSITVRFFTRAPGPPGLRNPEWLLLVRAVTLTLVGVQPQQLGDSPDAGTRLPFFSQGQARIPEAIGVFTADLSGGTPAQWTLQVAHTRYLLDMEVASGTYDMDTFNQSPLEQIALVFNFECSKQDGAGASVFSFAAAGLEYAATSALNIAQRSASWLARKALRITHQFSMRLEDDDTVSSSFVGLFTLFGGLSTSVATDVVVGKWGGSHGGLDALYFHADPAQPLDGLLRATWFRLASTKTDGEFDVHRPFVASCTWGGGHFKIFCKRLSMDIIGKKVPSLEDVSQLLEKLKVSPGGGHISDGRSSIFVGPSGV
mmetsp:Transcript_33389/g.76341  ORF Transcript_33389/g.76341 Transcript_33389/m.76341 type:complete len:475 (-) Transcript_33389:165-1589(-)